MAALCLPVDLTHRLAAAMLYDGGQRWHADLAHVVATFKDEAVDATHARVWSQSQLQNDWVAMASRHNTILTTCLCSWCASPTPPCSLTG